MKQPPFDSRQHRIFHITHLDNLRQILGDGQLRANANVPVDFSTPLIRELRASVPADAECSVADCVSFAISDQASWWRDLREGAPDRSRWSDSARAARASELVVLVSTLGELADTTLLTDADAAATVARFARTEAEKVQILSRVRAGTGALDGEALVNTEVPFEAIILVGVANEPARERVRKALTDAGYPGLRIVLNPEWFVSATQ